MIEFWIPLENIIGIKANGETVPSLSFVITG
jgi:hypothetical protein